MLKYTYQQYTCVIVFFFLNISFSEKNNDLGKAEAVWTKMQEENIVPRSRTLHLLGQIFKVNNQKIPFTAPQVN